MEWMENEMLSQQKHTPVINTMRGDAASIRTRASVAGSFLSRASNVIQIAFIPGVINRSNGGSSHNSLAPVPPIPARYANTKPKSPLANDGDMLFFRPGSTFSATSSRSGVRDTQYTQYTYGSRQSITPSLARSSMALEVYTDDATPPPMPATTMLRAAPRMVSVKSTPATTPNPGGNFESPGNTPKTGTSATIVPQGFGSSPQHSRTHSRRNSSMSLASSKGKGRFPVRSASADLTNYPPPISGRRTPTVSSPLITTNLDSEDDDASNPGDYEDDHARARQSLLQPSSATTRTESGSPTSPLTHSSSLRPMSGVMLGNTNNQYNLDPTSTSSSFMPGGAFRTITNNNKNSQPINSPFFDASDLPSQPINITNNPNHRPNPYANMSANVASTSPPKRLGAAKSFGGLGAVIEEAARKGSTPSSRAGSGPGSIVGVFPSQAPASSSSAAAAAAPQQGPFGDEHALR
jgi:hypothetical protein